MKKIILMCFCAIMAMGCKTASYPAKFTIGMTENEFKSANKTAVLVSSSTNESTIYRTTTNSWIPKPEPYSFFYFSKGKLVRFIKSDRMDDYKFIQ